jgi:hypothetical protein
MSKNKDYLFIYMELTKKQGTSFNIWNSHEFWLHWFEIEIKEKENKMCLKLEDFYFTILIEIASIMEDLKIDLKNIVFYIVEKIAMRYSEIADNGALIKELEEFIIRQHKTKLKAKEN